MTAYNKMISAENKSGGGDHGQSALALFASRYCCIACFYKSSSDSYG